MAYSMEIGDVLEKALSGKRLKAMEAEHLKKESEKVLYSFRLKSKGNADVQ